MNQIGVAIFESLQWIILSTKISLQKLIPVENQSPIQKREPTVNFNLQRMETIFLQANGKTDVPHRHDYYTVLLVESAKGKHLIDFKTFTFKKSEVHFVSPGQVHQVDVSQKPKGWVITFSRDFLLENNIPESFISNINLFQAFGNSPPLKVDKTTLERLKNILEEIENGLPSNLKYRNRALGALLQLFLIYCNNCKSLNPEQLTEENTNVCMLRDFKNLVEENFTQWHQVKKYASEIHISPKHLSHTMKQLTGKTAKEIIQDRLVLESKRFLLHTDLTIKEIAYKIGFSEPLHFSSFFKNKTEVSPTNFRNSKK